MNCKFSLTSAILIIILGIQSVSHSQYYPNNDNGRPSSIAVSSYISGNPPTINFDTRNYQPPYRQHQNLQHFINDLSGTTVRYFGTQSSPLSRQYTTDTNNAEVFEVNPRPEASFASYRRRYNGRSYLPTTTEYDPYHNNQFESPPRDVGITVRDDGEMDILIPDPERPFRRPEVIRIRSRSRQPFRDQSEFDSGSSIERPPETLVVVIHRPSSFSTPLQCADATHRIYRKDGKCYQLGGTNRNPCGYLMQLYGDKNNEIYADCDCLVNNGKVSRPLAYWGPHDRCYILWQRGPCQYNEWLILDRNGIPRCSPQKCASIYNEGEDDHEFWFIHEGRCYKTGQHYARICGVENKNKEVWFPYAEMKPNCSIDEPNPYGRALLSAVNDLRCRPGQKKMQNGECKKIAHFDDDY